MTNKTYTKHQQNIIKKYYENRDAISLQRLSELVTELYLAEGKARERQWKYLDSVLAKLGLPKERIEHLRKKDDPKLLAQLVEELFQLLPRRVSMRLVATATPRCQSERRRRRTRR